jgi:uncharacterized membrane protein YdjX (TVP38/TMEM64 family)
MTRGTKEMNNPSSRAAAVQEAVQEHRAQPSIARKVLPLAVLAALAVLVFWFDLDRYLTFAALKENRGVLMDFVDRHMLLAVLAYIAIYATATAVSLPGGAILSVAGGFLFGAWFGTLWIVIAATLGATGIFLIARTALGEPLHRRAGPALMRMEAGFRENAFSYLLTLRLIPLFPFFLVNLVPAFLGVTLRTYVLATVIGVVPGAFVFASSGVGLGSVFDSSDSFSAGSVLTPEILIALTGLGLLSLLPVVYKRVRARRGV